MTQDDQALMLQAIYEDAEPKGSTITFDSRADYEKWKQTRVK